MASSVSCQLADPVVYGGRPQPSLHRRHGHRQDHLARALGVLSGITQHGKRVRFYSTVDLVNTLEIEKSAGKQGKLAFNLMRMDW